MNWIKVWTVFHIQLVTVLVPSQSALAVAGTANRNLPDILVVPCGNRPLTFDRPTLIGRTKERRKPSARTSVIGVAHGRGSGAECALLLRTQSHRTTHAMNTTTSTSAAVESPPSPAGRRLVPARAYARVAEVTAVLLSTDDFDTFRIHVLNQLGCLDALGRSRIEDLVRVVWRRRDLLLSEADPVLRASSAWPPTPTADDVNGERNSPWSGRAEFEEELARDRAVAAALLAAPAWIEAAARRDPPWGKELANAVAALDDSHMPGRWLRGLHRSVMRHQARWFGSGLM